MRVGYYVNNDYIDPELRETPPEIPQFDKVRIEIKRVRRREKRWYFLLISSILGQK